ncbi:hypothetical protein IF650_11565 [Cellulosimicrobium terreum]|nr:hypothetical protein [Cellulosimicrobium terreum]
MSGWTGPGPAPEPGLTPEEALRRGNAWWDAAASSSGPQRAAAERSAAYWYAQHRTLVERRAATGLAPPLPAAATAQPYGQPYAQPYARPHASRRPRRRRRTVTALMFLLGTVGAVAVSGNSLGPALDRAWDAVADGPVTADVDGLPTEQDGAVPPPTVWDDPDGGTVAGGMEESWRAGDYASTVPDAVAGTEPTSPFLPEHPDPAEWLVALNPANEEIQVVFTDDPAYNCGMVHVEEHDAYAWGSAGCFHPSYPRTLFVWWSDTADPATKEFLLAHELSHMIQWWHDFDLMQSAVDAGLAEDEAWQRAVETDASCRVLSWGGYSEEAADRSSSPCETDAWSEAWLDEQAAARGVAVTDH